MNVTFPNTFENWKNWGALVRTWVSNESHRPRNTDELMEQMKHAGIKHASYRGAPAKRDVVFVQYSEDEPLYIPLPSASMVEEAEKKVEEAVNNNPGHRGYPIPAVFYSLMFGAAKPVDLSASQQVEYLLCRLGEYTINECM